MTVVNLARAALALFAIATLMASPARAVDTIPFTVVKGGLIAVQGSVDGQAPVPMLVDLGAGVDVLSTTLGRKLVLVKGKYVSLRLTGQRVDLPIGTIVSLAIGGVKVDAPHVGVWSGLDGTGTDGLISATAFRNIATTFDFLNHQIIIEDAQTFPERERTGIKVPVVLQDDLGIALGIFARFDFGGGKTGLCEIDTGSEGITLDKTFAASLGLDANAGSARLAAISIDGVPETAIERPTVALGNLIYDCNVGNSFWAGKLFTLDLPNRVLWVARRS
ncbi:MAG: aspartyl protease family protein [Candidatus Eremiobacteraeota bacterium]|nr:aspartyl protease family protein [Candidatus Eremiobacteraeota bacterium]MBV8499153.1 aspartyl protease family protein [Candidatus Eremiobacteraeota bacterium]